MEAVWELEEGEDTPWRFWGAHPLSWGHTHTPHTQNRDAEPSNFGGGHPIFPHHSAEATQLAEGLS